MEDSLQRYIEHQGIIGGTSFSDILRSHATRIERTHGAQSTTTISTIQQGRPQKIFWEVLWMNY